VSYGPLVRWSELYLGRQNLGAELPTQLPNHRNTDAAGVG
jgi:hypothetical protein